VYNSGGSFYVLAPNTEFVQNKLNEITATIEQHIFDTHGISLYVAIDSVSFSKETLLHKNNTSLGEIWNELFSKRLQKKSAKFSSQINDNYPTFFSPSMQGLDTKRDVITGEEFLPNEKSYSS